MTTAAMPTDFETFRLLLVLGEGFRTDDGLRLIVRMDEESEDYWDTDLAGLCVSCLEARGEALRRQQPPEGLTLPEVYAIAWWRPVRDAVDAWTFLAEHANCPRRPRLDIGIA